MRILIAEDEEDIRKLIALHMKKEGYEVITCKDGIEALQVFKSEEIHLALLDIMMPNIDGITVMEEIRKISTIPIIFISAKTGQRIDRLFGLIDFVYEQSIMRISTGMLNDILADATARVQPPSDKGKRLKIYYMTQASTKPPTFVCFCNRADLFHFSYQRYIENQIRKNFGGLEGTPVRIIVREKIEVNSKQPKYIKTIRGIGYKFEKVI